MEKTQRNSKFEILRIICMLMIIAHHLVTHGGYLSESVSSVNQGFMNSMIGGKLGVNLFVLISGYFLCKSKFKFSKLIKLMFEILFYSFFIYIVFVATGTVEFSVKEFFCSIFPISTNAYWFMTCYVVMYVLSPFINKVLNSSSKKECLLLICFLLVFQTIIPLAGFSYLSNVAWFITLYLIAGFLRLYPTKIADHKWLNIIVFCVSYLCIALFNVFLNISLWNATSIVCLICAVSLFNVFKNIKKPINSKFINVVASATLGVYLIHDNNYVRGWLWQTLLKCPDMAGEWFFPLFAIGAMVGVYVVCTLIDLVRIDAIERPFFALCDKMIVAIKTKWQAKKELKKNEIVDSEELKASEKDENIVD